MKYSIIIPTHNAIKYLPTCVSSIIEQDYIDYELIISDDHSTDGTKEYLRLVASEYKQIKVVHQSKRLSVVEHFEVALKIATGEWIMFLGSDDGLQSYFFELADILIQTAEENNIKTISSKRAYNFWEDCEKLYGNVAINFKAIKKYKVLNFKSQIFLSLIGMTTYFELPQMYTTSLFHKTLLDDVRKMHVEENVFTTLPPDSNLVAIAYSLQEKYIYSFVPLGWVGTSSTHEKQADRGILLPNIRFCLKAGNYSINSTSLYLWNAILQTNNLRSSEINSFFSNKYLIILIYAGVVAEINRDKQLSNELRIKKIQYIKDAIKTNQLNEFTIFSLSQLSGICYVIFRYSSALFMELRLLIYNSYRCKIIRNQDRKIILKDISNKILTELKKRNII